MLRRESRQLARRLKPVRGDEQSVARRAGVKAASISPLVLALRTCNLKSEARAHPASLHKVASLVNGDPARLTSAAIRTALGKLCKIPSRLAATSGLRN